MLGRGVGEWEPEVVMGASRRAGPFDMVGGAAGGSSGMGRVFWVTG